MAATEVCRNHSGASVGGQIQKLAAGGARIFAVFAEHGVPLWAVDLGGVMEYVANKQGTFSPVLNVEYQVARSMARKKSQGHPGGYAMAVFDWLGQAAIQHWLYAILENIAVDFSAHCGGSRVVAAGVPVIAVDTRKKVARIWKGRGPTAALKAGIPADVINMQVGVDDNIDIFRCEAGLGEILQKISIQLTENGNAGTVLMIPCTGIIE